MSRERLSWKENRENYVERKTSLKENTENYVERKTVIKEEQRELCRDKDCHKKKTGPKTTWSENVENVQIVSSECLVSLFSQ